MKKNITLINMIIWSIIFIFSIINVFTKSVDLNEYFYLYPLSAFLIVIDLKEKYDMENKVIEW